MDLKDITAFIAAVGVVIGGGFGLWRWVVDQKWRRVQYAQSIIKASFEDELVEKACEVLDTNDGIVTFADDHKPERDIYISDDFLIGALATFDQKEGFSDDELCVRGVLDKLFDEMNTFQSHIDAGLIKLDDIRPYIEYWIREMSGNGRVHEERLAHQIHRFLEYFGYRRALRLASNMGYPIKEGAPTSSSQQPLVHSRPSRHSRHA